MTDIIDWTGFSNIELDDTVKSTKPDLECEYNIDALYPEKKSWVQTYCCTLGCSGNRDSDSASKKVEEKNKQVTFDSPDVIQISKDISGKESEFNYSLILKSGKGKVWAEHNYLPSEIYNSKKAKFIPCPFNLSEELMRSCSTQNDLNRCIREFPNFFPFFIKPPILLCVLTCQITEGQLNLVKQDCKNKKYDKEKSDRIYKEYETKRNNSGGGMVFKKFISTEDVIAFYKMILYSMQNLEPSYEKKPYVEVRDEEKKIKEKCEENITDLINSNQDIRNIGNQMKNGMLSSKSREEVDNMFPSESLKLIKDTDLQNTRTYIRFLEKSLMKIHEFSEALQSKLLGDFTEVNFSKVSEKKRYEFLDNKYRRIMMKTDVSAVKLEDMLNYNMNKPSSYPNSLDYAQLLASFF